MCHDGVYDDWCSIPFLLCVIELANEDAQAEGLSKPRELQTLSSTQLYLMLMVLHPLHDACGALSNLVQYPPPM